MKNTQRNVQNRGFALVMAIFLVIGLETVLAGAMFNMMRLQREAQRSADETGLSWAAETVIERAIKLLGDYILLTGAFPNRFYPGSTRLQGGIQTPGTNLLTGGQPRNFDAYLMDWFNIGTFRTKPDHQPALSDIEISNVEIHVTGANLVLNRTSYSITVTAHKLVGGVRTPFQVTITHLIERNISKLFDIPIFCIGDCELAAGPNFTVPGPVFSNGNIYLMNDSNDRGITNTMTIKLPDTFFDPFTGLPNPANPEPYLLHAHQSTYFYHKRFIGPNYLLGQSQIYFNSVPDYYKFADLGSIKPADGLVKTPEVHGVYNLGDSKNPRYPPYFHFPVNGADCLTNQANGNSCPVNMIKFETLNGLETVAPPLPKMFPAVMPNLRASFYTPESEYTTGKIMSVSSAFDPVNFPLNDLVVPEISSKWTIFWQSTQYPTDYTFPYLIADDVDKKELPLGHDLITPCASIPCTAAEEGKMQAKATFQLLFLSDNPKAVSADYQLFEDEGIITNLGPSMDYRNKGSAGYENVHFVLDIAELLLYLKSLASPPKRIIIYFAHMDPARNSIMIINGEKIPKDGLSIATSGRLWIRGDYNTFSYTFENKASCAAGSNDPKCYCTDNNNSTWDAHNCHPPAAGFFTDSIGAVSEDWKTMSEGYGASTPLSGRKALSNVMVNAAIATGSKSSERRKTDDNSDKVYDYEGCNDNSFKTRSEACMPRWDGRRRVIPPSDGTLLKSGNSNPDVFTFLCPNPNKTYEQGREIKDSSCEFYRESDEDYNWYVNPNSWRYKRAVKIPGSTLPSCGFLVGDANRDGTVDTADYVVWRKQSGQMGYGLPSDFDQDGDVDSADHAIMRAHWGNTEVLGDANGDGKVDTGDYVVWRKQSGQTGPGLSADFDQDDDVDQADYAIMRANWGKTMPPLTSCDYIRIPIFADPNTTNNLNISPSSPPVSVPPFPGVYYTILNRPGLFGIDSRCIQSEPRDPCPDPLDVGPPINRPIACSETGSEDTDPNPTGCSERVCPVTGNPPGPSSACIKSKEFKVAAIVNYPHPREYYRLHKAIYGGGIENLINLQEDWRGMKFRFLGTLSIPWPAMHLPGDYTTSPAYYKAPERIFDYNEDLRFDPPPGTPDFSSVKRMRWSRRFDS